MTFPADSVLIERGKYSTLASERRELLKELRDDMEAVADYARRCLRNVDSDLSFARDSAEQGAQRIDGAITRLAKLAVLAGELETLKPLAWAKETPE